MAFATDFAPALVLLACACCGNGGGAVDAAITVDIDNGSCGDQLRLTGEYVDWDTDASFCGINEATWTEEGDGGMDTTAPNGRFDLCVSRASTTTKIIITQPTAMSSCTTPPSTYTTPAIAFVDHAEVLAGGFFSARAFTDARRTTFFQNAGLTFDATKAHVFVHVDGTPRAVSLAANHDAAQAIAAASWAAGNTGHEVFFPNVDVGGGTTALSVAGGAIGTGEIPLIAGTITNVTVLAN
ncbi:MAG: hypothetical protein AB7P03_28645 [Kofleriaceae bacterium]